MNLAPTYKKIEILIRENNSQTKNYFVDSGLVISGDHLIIMSTTISEENKITTGTIFKLSDVVSYRTYNKIN